MSNTMSVHGARNIGELWRPGEPLDEQYPLPSSAELCGELQQLVGEHEEVFEPADVFGALRRPRAGEQIDGVMSVDLCEVLRYTARSLADSMGIEEYNSNRYMDALWDASDQGPEYLQNVLQAKTQLFMHMDLVKPVEDHDKIAELMQGWRKERGVYVVANTSTLPGCEIPTLRFLNQYYPDCFDGIVLPRNHDGNGKITKADALSCVLEELAAYGAEPQFAGHIDDTIHHLDAMAAHPPHAEMRLFAPALMGNEALAGREDVQVAATSREAFDHMHMYIDSRLVALEALRKLS